MDKRDLRTYFLDRHEKLIPNLYSREENLIDSNRIQVLIGARRSGKTFLLFQTIKSQISQGLTLDQILYLNFEDIVFQETKIIDFREIFEVYWSTFPKSQNLPLQIYIDEPQAIPQWESSIRMLYDEFKYRIFITGSSSKLLSKEIATNLRGRTLPTIILPLSFREFLDFRNQKFDSERLSTLNKSKLDLMVQEYFTYGGYPEVVIEKDPIIKLRILQDLLDITIFKDLIDRFKIQNFSLIKYLVKFIVVNTTKEISIHKLWNSLKSQGMNISKNTLYEYFGDLEEIMFIHSIKRFVTSLKKTDLTISKVFLNDFGFFTLYSGQNKTRILENVVFLELLRRTKNNPLMHLFFWKSNEEKEVDFLITEQEIPKWAIQVSYSLQDEDTKKREIQGLLACMQTYSLSEGYILTYDEQAIIENNNLTIKVIPIWKWLMLTDFRVRII